MINRNTPLEDLPEILTPQEIADHMGLDRYAVYEMMKIPQKLGGIPNFPLGNGKRPHKRTLKRDYISWLNRKTNVERGAMYA
ncbi:hypothetical protein NKT34_13810 [Paenibacillus polysaccharolyticus]|uniref:hypothetical protein n=1 Tax=Paenibacillus polysaccharolyticus TaxID=582692 RepID=UPI0020A0CBF8|nr:hypothetical protein [Paenibacillus polysaccharolyticus]MCP1134376.1 hypothetical protein [Paenibacillus polysaccharolyticus]